MVLLNHSQMPVAKKQKIAAQSAQQCQGHANTGVVTPSLQPMMHLQAKADTLSADETKNTFAPADGKEQVKAPQTHRLVVEVYTNTILTQAKMGHLTGVDGIEEHETTAKEHASTWTATVAPTIIEINQDIIDFSNKFNFFMTPLQAALKDILANQPVDGDSSEVAAQKAAALATAVATIQQGLQLLLRDVIKHRENAETAILALEAFLKDVQSDASNFASDYTEVGY